MYWAIATGGAGGNAKATVVGPFSSVQDLMTHDTSLVIGQFQILGSQTGYPNRLQAQAVVNAWNANPTHPPVIGSKDRPLHAGPPGNPPSSPLAPLQAIGDFFNRLTEPNTWIRIGEVTLGIILIGVGLAKLTGVENTISKAVSKMPAVIPV